MALEAQDGVVRTHAAAVVYYLDEGAAGVKDNYLDVRGSGVHCILHEFLYHGGRPLHHLPRGNHVCDILW